MGRPCVAAEGQNPRADETRHPACSPEQAGLITGKLRPYKDLEDLRKKLSKTRGVSPALFQQYIDIVNGYIEVDQCLAQCEAIGNEIAQIMSIWTGQPLGARTTGLRGGGGTPSAGNSGTATPSGGETGIHATSVDVSKLEELVKKDNSKLAQRARAMYRAEQPAGLVEGVKLKDYQLLGLNWLHLLWSKKLSCILADDMGVCRAGMAPTQTLMCHARLQALARPFRSSRSCSSCVRLKVSRDPISSSSRELACGPVEVLPSLTTGEAGHPPSKTGLENSANSPETSTCGHTMARRRIALSCRKSTGKCIWTALSRFCSQLTTWRGRRMTTSFSGRGCNSRFV